ncbi:MAG: hypothetical protein V4582_22700 [Pseudomonadota bacterium]
MRRLPLAVAILAGLASAPAWSAQYRDVYDVYAPFSSLKGYQFLRANVKVVPAQRQIRAETIRLVIHARQGDVSVAVAGDGTMPFPLDATLYRENPAIEFNQPKGSIALTAGMEAISAPRLQFNFKLYDAMAEEYRRWQHERLGLLARMHMPSPKALLLRFPPAAHGAATVALPSGPLRLEANGEGELRIPENSEWSRQDPLITLNSMPATISLGMD